VLSSEDTRIPHRLRQPLNPHLSRSEMVKNPSKNPLYHIWYDMLARCNRPHHQAFKNYGGRGISVCERWNSFDNFLEDMSPRPDGYTLDRLDNSKGYSPENCKWTSWRDQALNRRHPPVSGASGHRWAYRTKNNKFQAQYKEPGTRKTVRCGLYPTAGEASLAACAHRLENYWSI
jgi:hypothetical protein